jgi:glycosyltransferase involved in cell wall biosynthesis
MPAVIHSNGFRADIVSNQLDLPAPRIATLRNYPQLDYARTYGRALGAWMARRHVTALRKKDMVVCVSAAVEENIHTYGVRSTTVIRNGVDTESFTPASAAEKAELRDRLGMPRDAFIWTVSGVLTARKNPEFILDGFARTFAGDPLHQLVFVGGGDLEASLRKRAAGNGNIRVVGPVTSVAAYLRMSDVNIAASSAEGLPNSVLEALACGLPALLSDIGPHREIAALAPASVTLFPLESTEGFAAGARKVVQSLGSPTLPVPHSRLPQELTAPVMSQSYADLYRRTIAASR